MTDPESEVILSRHDLHVLANANDAIIRTSEQFLALLGPSPFPDLRLQTLDNVAPIFGPSADTLAKQLTDIVERLAARADVGDRAAGMLRRLRECVDGLRGAIDVFGLSSPDRLAEYTSTAIHVLDLLHRAGPLPKEHERNIRRSARELGRLIYIYSLQRNTALLHHHAPLLRAHLSPNKANMGTRHLEDRETTLARAIGQAINAIQPLAQARGIRIDRPPSIPAMKLTVPDNVAVLALKNLLENAVKYTGLLPSDSQYPEPWIVLRIKDRMASNVLEIESWGAPVTHEEHAGKLYLKRGYRGHFAYKLGIDGSGTGLAEAREIFEEYGATIEIDTRPVDKNYSTERSVQFTVRVEFPKP
jgi:signal transduction histidine kinase